MQNTALENFVAQVKTAWSGLNTETVGSVRQLLINLTKAAADFPEIKNKLLATQSEKIQQINELCKI